MNNNRATYQNGNSAIGNYLKCVILMYSSDGDGIPVQDLPHIFDRFYKGKNGNFGLGLAIVKSAILSLKGSRSEERRVGKECR